MPAKQITPLKFHEMANLQNIPNDGADKYIQALSFYLCNSDPFYKYNYLFLVKKHGEFASRLHQFESKLKLFEEIVNGLSATQSSIEVKTITLDDVFTFDFTDKKGIQFVEDFSFRNLQRSDNKDTVTFKCLINGCMRIGMCKVRTDARQADIGLIEKEINNLAGRDK